MSSGEAVRAPKRARLYVTRIDPWSVTKAAFMLALACMVKRSPYWSGARLRLCHVVEKEEARDEAMARKERQAATMFEAGDEEPFTLRRSLMPCTYDFDASTVTRTDCSDSFTAFTATGAAGVV